MSLLEGGKDTCDTEEGNLPTEARCYTAGCEAERSGYKQRMQLWGLEKARFSSKASRESMALMAICFQPSETILDYLTPELYETKYVLF